VRQSPRMILLRVHLGHVSAEHLVEQSQKDRKQRVLHQWQPRGQILRRAEVPQKIRSDGDDLGSRVQLIHNLLSPREIILLNPYRVQSLIL